ncbi:RNA-directed DNA polymerase [Fluviicola taffensis]|nr:RNA-directed DNA polymerase [Fluviicola taffensis]
MNTLDQIAETKNLTWAWEKAKSFYQPGDIWFDELEVAQFEINLKEELRSIQESLLNGSYNLNPILPVAFPKKKDDDGPRTRQTFWIKVRDQVTWLAVVNIIGKELDYLMPFWSYGNRLYISTFYEWDAASKKRELNFGYYRNTTKNTYRKWSQSWPLYRRHINLTSKFLSGNGAISEELDENEIEMLEVNKKLDNTHPLKVNYIESSYWTDNLSGQLFWAGVDLEKFYPNLNNAIIESNIREYLPNQEEKLYDLISNLLAFEIDTVGWTDEELKKISAQSGEFNHLPTGLFVAGFLSNVALLKIDKIINDKLNTQKNIAHFRYVDDHVILATSFEDLTKWLEEYRQIIEGEELGTNFNVTKTEPIELGKYLEASEDQKKDGKLYQSAVEAAKLDPDFPSPLMTQTLAKVSKIASTEFHLLGPDEEKSLIADIEHLLVTEFPDQELRRDTRVAFAARMLSSLVPQLTFNIEAYYGLQSKLVNLSIELEKSKKKKEDTSVIKSEIKLTNELIKKEQIVLDTNEQKISDRTIKLLLKAIRENHQKVRLWSRILEFLSKSGSLRINKVLKEIEDLKGGGETNNLSITFIHSLTLQVITQLLLKAFRIVTSKNSSYKQLKRSKGFMQDILKDSLFKYFDGSITEKSKTYEKNSLDLFKFCSGTILYLLEEDKKGLIQKYNLINWDDPNRFCRNTNYDFSVWIWWLYNQLPYEENKEPYLWKNVVPLLNPSKINDQVLIQLFPKNLNIELLKGIDENKSSFEKNEGWLFDVYQGLVHEGASTEYDILAKIRRKTVPLKDYITLYDWIEWLQQREVEVNQESKEHIIFDPRVGEWMALEVIKQIAVALKEKFETIDIFDFSQKADYSRNIHPNNFKLDRDWIDKPSTRTEPLTWETLRLMVRKKQITLRAKDDLIYDNRFIAYDTDNFMPFISNRRNESIINSLGSLLICLLSKNNDLPNRWNPLGHQQNWLSLAKVKLKNVPISSVTRDIIDGCFSKRNQETAMIRYLETKKGHSFVDDTSLDPPYFVDIQAFIKYIDFSQLELEKQQLSVSNHQPRQLIPIHLKQMNRDNYQELIEE